MDVSDFEYELPPERIAQVPSEARDAARLLHHRVHENETVHRGIADLPELLNDGDLLVVNDTRVRAARLHVQRAVTGGSVELLVTGPASEPGVFRALARPAKKLKAGEELVFAGEAQRIALVDRPSAADGSPGIEWHFRLADVAPRDALAALDALCERQGQMPLPPYVRRGSKLEAELAALDRERYQTVYARSEARAVAAPTAGLHFTPELLQRIEARGVRTARVTL
ncbi:MAG: S-adenosylmethionine:tRNA ribosyltransferase-isomerase, partial [Planctomycetota bacterium]